MKKISIPQSVLKVLAGLEAKNFEAFVVGGCVRDLLLNTKPNDWDVTTSAKPKEILKIFPDGKYENNFGTVMVPEKYLDNSLDNLEVASRSIKVSKTQKKEAVEIAKSYLKRVKDGIHEIDHTERVIKSALEIARDYPKINPDTQELICWFHDVGLATKPSKEHIKESQRIVKKELKKLLEEGTVELLAEAIDHTSQIEYKHLEQQILKEADVIDGINMERFKTAKKDSLKEHIEWVKEAYYKKKIYEVFKTQKGKELLKKETLNFNRQSPDFKLEEPGFDASLKNIEITTYRIESKYSDKRHPDEIKFAKTLEEDLSRRDFTVNAMALRVKDNKHEIVDLFDGQKDLKKKLIRAVGKAEERFDEDALRMMRAVRFASSLKGKWEIEEKTAEAIKKNADNLKHVSKERIRDELTKIILSDRPAWGIDTLVETKLMKHIILEIKQTIGVRQNRHHYNGPYNTVYAHLLASLEKCPSKKLEVRLAAFLHDIGKPKTKQGEGEMASFHAHEYAGAHMVKRILERLKFPRKVVEKTTLLVRNHMFYYNVDEVGEKGVRKVIRKVGLENIGDLIDVRIGDRLGSGVPKAVPYRLRHFQYMVDKVSADPISVGQLKINGNDLMNELKIKPGPKIGAILEVLLAKVIDDPNLNKKEKLAILASQLKDRNIENLRDLAKEKIASEKDKKDKDIKEKHWVK